MEHKHVLVVDDEESLTAFLEHFFTRLGYRMHVASNGTEALEVLEQHKPALMLLDMRMPGMDGIQILREVKGRQPAVKVIVMTSFDEKYEQEAKQNRADAFFAKPLSLAELSSKIKELLQADDPPGPAAVSEVSAGLIPKAKLLFVNVGPHASMMMVGALHCVGGGMVHDETKDYPDAGDYQWEEAYHRKEVLQKLQEYRPDFVLICTDWEEEEYGLFRSRSVKASDLVAEILRSKQAPKEVFLFGPVSDDPDKKIMKEPGWGDFEKQAAKINRLLWQKCEKFGLMAEHPKRL